ncbi:hypothetical protein [Pseudofrankia inefficax]|uniref:Condensation domain protein n=1 Tax=Pseudofrankia inefficax (strain DSM 45817 / CECT 9037 / DDB 130130 / EuI1c) TaxID=298654 RepID=E3J4P7_PSEI1|nr:hypothetical protein [Pseudofrankia inefficax]ADP78216.1 hypothetical protein FraEuI1c_0128 [Pseudofrankia inefficax]
MAKSRLIGRPGEARGIPISGRDLICLHMRTVAYLGPIEAPSPEQVRGALRRLAELLPAHRILRRVDRAAPRWVTVPAAELPGHCDAMVIDMTDTTAASATSVPATAATAATPETIVARLYNWPVTDLPFQIAVGADFCALLVDHACIDGLSINEIWPELIRCAVTGEYPVSIAKPSIRFPLIRALDNYYRRKPKRLVETVRVPHPTPPADATEPGPLVPWHQEFGVVSVRFGKDVLAEIRSWRLANAKGITRTMVLFAAARAALETSDLPPVRPGVNISVDMRKFLPQGAVLYGNFAPSIYVCPADGCDPAQLNAVIDEVMSVARPLATMALVASTAKRRFKRTAQPPTLAEATARPALSLIHCGRLKAFEKLPWTGSPADRRYVIGSTPGDPDGISVFISEIHGGVDVTATFNVSTFDPAVVRGALEILATEPTRALDARRQVPSAR